MSYVNKQAEKFEHLTKIAEELWSWAENKGIWIEAVYEKGTRNVIADRESRAKIERNDWMLNKRIFQKITQLWGKPTIDLFAARTNKQVDRFISWRPDPDAWGTDAFKTEWPKGLLYANPPFNLIGRFLRLVEKRKATVILIAPWWETAPWFPILNHLKIQPPWILPRDPNTFLPATYQHQIPFGCPKWKVAAWKISGSIGGGEATTN